MIKLNTFKLINSKFFLKNISVMYIFTVVNKKMQYVCLKNKATFL